MIPIVALSLLAVILVGIALPLRQRTAARVARPDDEDAAAWRVVAADTGTLVVAWAMLTLAAVTAGVVIANLANLAGGAVVGLAVGVPVLLLAAAYPTIRFVAVVRTRLAVGDHLARLERNSRRSSIPPTTIAT